MKNQLNEKVLNRERIERSVKGQYGVWFEKGKDWSNPYKDDDKTFSEENRMKKVRESVKWASLCFGWSEIDVTRENHIDDVLDDMKGFRRTTNDWTIGKDLWVYLYHNITDVDKIIDEVLAPQLTK